ncbi:MAG: hypothetical protein WCD76_15220 [Pyrinomonadaceae bacterium]
MEENKDPKTAHEVSNESTDATPKRDEDATSNRTLSDLEESETVTSAGDGGGSDTSSSLEGSSPAPTDGGGRSSDGSDSGGPM